MSRPSGSSQNLILLAAGLGQRGVVVDSTSFKLPPALSQNASASIHLSSLSYNFKNLMNGDPPSPKLFSKTNNEYPRVPLNDFQSSFALKSFLPLRESYLMK